MQDQSVLSNVPVNAGFIQRLNIVIRLVVRIVVLTRTNEADGENAEAEATERATIVAVNFILFSLVKVCKKKSCELHW